MPTKFKQSRIIATFTSLDLAITSFPQNRTICELELKSYPKNKKELIALALYCFESSMNPDYITLYFESKSLTNLVIYAKEKHVSRFSGATRPRPDLPIANYEKYQIEIKDISITIIEPPKLEEFLTSKNSFLRQTAKKELTNGD